MSNDPVPAPTVELRFRPSCPEGYAAIVVLCGEHDLATSGDVEAAVSPVDGPLLIDLSQCEFVDSTVVGVMMAKSKALAREGHQLTLVVPPSNRQIRRVFDVIGMASMATLLDEMPPSLADSSAA